MFVWRFLLRAALPLAALTALALNAAAQSPSAFTKVESLGPNVNTSATDGCPFIAADGLTLYFASNRPGGKGGLDIYVMQRSSSGSFTTPTPVTAVESEGGDYCPTLSEGGRFLYFVSDRAGGCGGADIYVTRREDLTNPQGWGPPSNLGCRTNSSADDVTPTLLHELGSGTERLYFHSTRPGGPGGADVYTSVRERDGAFGPASLVSELSTPANDLRPNVRADGLVLYLESNRPGGLGGSDLWVARRASVSDAWGAPVNLGAPVNTSADEGRPSIRPDGSELFFMSNRPGGAGGMDLYVARP